MSKRLFEAKECACGILHDRIPDTAKVLREGDALDGYYWDCPCRSTLWSRFSEVDETEYCDCPDCEDTCSPCRMDCDADDRCQGCRESNEDEKDLEFEAQSSKGRV